MIREDAARLTLLFDLGYKIVIGGHPFVDTFVKEMGQLDYDSPDESPYVYSDEHMEEKPLEEVYLSDVQIYKAVSFMDEEPEEQELIEN